MIRHHLLSNLATLCNESTAASSLSQYYSASRNGGRLEVFPDSPKWRVATTKIFINRLIFKLPSRKLPEYGKISHNFQWNYGCRANNSPFGGLKPDRHFSWRVRLAELEKFWYLSFNISIILTFFNDARAEFLTTRTAQLYSLQKWVRCSVKCYFHLLIISQFCQFSLVLIWFYFWKCVYQILIMNGICCPVLLASNLGGATFETITSLSYISWVRKVLCK